MELMSWHNIIFSSKISQRIRLHVIFWLLWWIYFAATYYYYIQVGQQQITFGNLSSILFLKTFLLVLVHIVSCYAFIYFLLPRYLLTGKYFLFASGVVLLSVFLLFTGYYIHLLVFPIIDKAYHNSLPATTSIWWVSINSVLINAPKIIAAATAIKLVKRWYLKQKEKERIEKEKLVTDLQLLKAQIRPVFLFSSLDHIHNYARTRSPKAPELLLKFSELLSYLLYECDEPWVKLDKELQMMKEYMAMEKIRYGEQLDLEFQIKGNTRDKTIAPLLLLPFIENSFNQCFGHAEQSWINLEITIDKNMLTMKLMNGVDPDIRQPGLEAPDIKNVEKRLRLLYPGNYELKMYAEQEIYMTLLRINLDEGAGSQPSNSSTAFNIQKSLSTHAVN
jgi:sensor histidine kinase YesM